MSKALRNMAIVAGCGLWLVLGGVASAGSYT